MSKNSEANSPTPQTNRPGPGRSIADMPKGPPKDIPSAQPKPLNTRLTFRQWLTANESKEYLVPFLRELGMKKTKGPWKEYLEFYIANQSGDVDSMSPAVKAKCEKMIAAVEDAYFKEQDL